MNRNGVFSVDWGIFIPVIILVVLGLTTLFSINVSFFKTQLIYVIFSIFVFIIFSNVNYKILQYYSFKNFLIIIALLFPVFFLIYLQPDLGNALIYAGVALFTLITFGFPLLWFAVGFILLGLLFPFIWHFLHDYQKQRVLTFINPSHDPLGSSYNVIQSMVAVGSGMFFGKGLGEGTQSALRFLPERHTDFIFATFSEEFGFVGGLVIILS